jgi:riboflavin kinase
MAKRTKVANHTNHLQRIGFRSSELLKKIVFSGTVFTGGGEGKTFVDLPWVKRQIKETLGFIPYSGTLNLRLSEESEKRRKLLEKAHSVKVCPFKGYHSGVIIKASLGTLKCAIAVPEIVGYPKNVLEIIAPVNLREKLQLENGAEVTVTVVVNL